MIIKFIRKNMILSILLFVSILVVIKFSELHFLPFTPTYLEIVFLKPVDNTAEYEIFALMENLSLAYIASLMFYIIVDYIPKEKMAKKSLDILEKKLVSLYLYTGEIISYVLAEIKLDKELDDILKEDLIILDEQKFSHNSKYYISYTYIDGIKNDGCTKLEFIFKKDIIVYSDLVLKSIENIKNMPCIMYADFKLIEILSSIESNRFFKQLNEIKDIPEDVHFRNFNLGVNFYNLIQSLLMFDDINFKKHRYKLIEMTEIEKSEFITTRDELRKDLRDDIGVGSIKRIKNGIVL